MKKSDEDLMKQKNKFRSTTGESKQKSDVRMREAC